MSASSSIPSATQVPYQSTSIHDPQERCYICLSPFEETATDVVGHAAIGNASKLTCFLHRECCVKMLTYQLTPERLSREQFTPFCGHCHSGVIPPSMTQEETNQWNSALATATIAADEERYQQFYHEQSTRRLIAQSKIAAVVVISVGSLVATTRYAMGSEFLFENPVLDTIGTTAIIVLIVATWTFALNGLLPNLRRMHQELLLS